MKWRDWLAEWGLDSLKINLKFLELEWKPQDADRKEIKHAINLATWR